MAESNQHDEVARSLAGDADAYARIVLAHQEAVWRRMRRFARDRSVVEELVQEAFVEAYYSLAKYRGSGPLAAWLDRIATRVGYRFWRRQARRRETAHDANFWREVSRQSAATLDPDRAAELVHELLDWLPPRDRLVLLLLYVEGHTVAEAAHLAGWSKTMVKVQAFRARGKLRKRMAKMGIASLADAIASVEVAPALGATPHGEDK